MNDPDPLTFLLDESIDHDVARVIRSRGHIAHTATDVPAHSDAQLRTYAETRGWVFIAHDSDFYYVAGDVIVGRHLQYSGSDTTIVRALQAHFDDLVAVCRHNQDVFVTFHLGGFTKDV